MSRRLAVRRPVRGSALLETAIGTTLMVTIISFGIYFAEVGYLSLKVQESAISALWNGTHRKMHTTALDYTEADSSMEAAGADAARRYADFNGLSYVNGPPGITQTFTTGRDLTVACDIGGGNGNPEWDGALLTQLIYRNQGATRCGAQAELGIFRFPRSFLDRNSEGGLYQQRHADARFDNLRVCSVGRPVSGQCAGSFAMLVDDWGLAGGNVASETITCQMVAGQMPYEMNPPIYVPIPCLNLPYFSAAYGTYLPTAIVIPYMADSMPLSVLQFPAPINSRYFFMSAPGEELGMMQLPTLDQWRGSGLFPTTPGSPQALSTPNYGYSWLRRLANGRCFLGKDCD